jgi:PAS domain S-box-containing protein
VGMRRSEWPGPVTVGLVGGGRGGSALLDLLLDWSPAQVLVVIDPRADAPAVRTARARGIPTARHHRAVFDHPVAFVLELTGRPAVLDELLRTRPTGVEVISAGSLRLFWQLLEERRLVQERLHRTTQLQMVGELASHVLRAGASLEEALDRLCRVVESQRGDFHCSVLLVEPDGQRLRHVAAPSLPGVYVRAVDGVAIGPRGGSCGTAAHRGEPVFVADIMTDPLWSEYRELALPHGLRACWSVPILASSGAVLGTLAVYHREPRTPDREDRELIDMAGRLAALLVERAQAESALRTSEERYRLLFERNPHPMWVHDPETLRFLAINDAATRQYGHSREEFLALTLKDIRPAEDVPALLDALASGDTADRQDRGVWRHQRKDGTLLDAEIVFEHIPFAGRAAHLVLAHDVTERRRAEAATTTLARVGRELTATLDLAEAMHRIVSTVVSFFGVQSSALYRVNTTGDTLVCLAAAGGDDSDAWIGRTVPVGLGVVGPAVTEGRTVWSADLLADPQLSVPDWMRDRARAEGFRSVVAAPLRSGNEVLGALVLRDVAGRLLSERELELLSAFADQAALALRNAEAHTAVVARVRELDALVQVSRVLMGMRDDRAVVEAILDATSRLVPDSAAVVWEDWPGEDELRLVGHTGLRTPEEARRLQLRRGDCLAGLATVARAPITSQDLVNDPRVGLKSWVMAEGLVSGVASPMIQGDTAYGALVVYTRRPHAFSATELNLLTSLSSLGAAAMANARFFAREQARKAEAEALLQIAQAIGSTLELKPVLKIIAQRTAQAVGATRCSINLWRDGHLRPVMSQFADGHADGTLWNKFKEMGPYRLEDVPAHAAAIRTQEPVLIDDVRGSDLIPADWIETFGLGALMVVPLIHQAEVIGTLNLDRAEGPYAWRPEQVNAATVIANQATLALDNARLYAKVQTQLKELQSAQAQLVQAGKLSAVGQLVSGVAHELNNPLSVVIGYGRLLLAAELRPDVRRRVEHVVSHGDRMARIVQGLLLFARQGAPERRPLNVRDVIEQIVNLRATRLKLSGIRLEMTFGADVPLAQGDANQLQQVILNLLLNAEQAMLGRGAGGRRVGDLIHIATSCRPAGKDKQVVVQVADNGPGIPPQILPRIFEPFFTTKQVGEGTGLGLSVSYGIVEQHGGRLSVESSPGRTVFTLELPSAPEVAPAAPTTDARATGRVNGVHGRRVLVVDDEPEIADLVATALGQHGWSVDVAASGRAGLARVRETSYDLVVSDIRMADGSGEEFYRAAVALRAHLAERFLFITGDTASRDAWQFLQTTHLPVLQKPFTLEALIQATERFAHGTRRT